MGQAQAVGTIINAVANARKAREAPTPAGQGLGSGTAGGLTSSEMAKAEEPSKSKYQMRLSELDADPEQESLVAQGSFGETALSDYLEGNVDESFNSGLEQSIGQAIEQQQQADRIKRAQAESDAEGDMSYNELMNKVNTGAQLVGTAANSARSNIPRAPATPNFASRGRFAYNPTQRDYTAKANPTAAEILRRAYLTGR